ncbi:MAG TPA: thiol reductant ABC exporter subunit CydD [Solirubrobacteraceae bacterium]|nr:thiol reductant ABC exporter subunit CydD [Solirubrobacteraceae bacterium]
MPAPLDRRLLRESRAARAHLASVGLLSLLSAATILAQATLLARIVDRAAFHHATLAELRGSMLLLAIALLARAAIGGAFELAARLGAVGVISDLRRRLARHLLRDGAVSGGRGPRTGELAEAAVQGVDALQAYFAGYLPQLVLASVVPIAVLCYAATVDPLAAGIVALSVPVLILFMVLIGRGAREQARGRWRALALLSSHFLDVVKGLTTLRAYRREQAQAQTLARVGERYRAETMSTLRVAFLSAFVLELCAMIGTAMAAAAIGVQLAGGHLELQAGLTVLLLAPELYGPLRGVGQQFHAATDGTSSAERIFAVLDRPPALTSAPPTGSRRGRTSRVPDPAREPLSLHGVSFAYPDRPQSVLSGIDLELAPGELTALVGPSGAGKSTIARLLMRLADPLEGVVSCGGIDLREIDAERWREQVAWVPQRPQLFTGTVAQNIRLGAPHATDVDVERASRAAGAAEFIERLPHGLQTRVGEDGRRLSIGQRQRLALARALMRDAPLLVLDEPTAHLDDASTAGIADALPLLAAGRTVLLIVHDPTLAEHAQRIVRISAGTVVPDGAAPLAPAPSTAELVA